ncbi:hypothetical protein EDC04DRAFT_3092289 [Pisolithus marmoratus]|nr:hypothetical protein EDC04DRAFT_3092289 [Pisolithus marmoratus]
MDNFSYTDSVRAALASCCSCFTAGSSSNATSQSSNVPVSRSNTQGPNDLERLLRDTDSDALSLHSNFGASPHRRARQRRRPKFSLTLFGYTLFGRPPIYLSDDEDEGTQGRHRTLTTTSSFTFDSDAAPLDTNTIEQLTSPDHRAAVQRELEMRRREEQERAARKAQRRARREERKVKAQTSTLMTLTGGVPAEDDGVEEFRGSSTVSSLGGVEVVYPTDTGSNSSDADDADLGAGTYVRRKGQAHGRNGSTSDSKSRTSASVSTGDGSHTQRNILSVSQPAPYSQSMMQLPDLPKKKSRRASKRASPMSSSTTSQSTSNAPYTPPSHAEYVSTSPPVTSFPIPQKREEGSYGHDPKQGSQDFPITGLSGSRRPRSKDIGAFLSGMNDV